MDLKPISKSGQTAFGGGILGICVGSAKSLVQRGILPATQILPGSPWMVPVEALSSEAVQIGVQGVVERRPKFYEDYQYDKVVRLPGI